MGTGVSGRSPAGTPARTAIQARTGSALPFALIGSNAGWYSITVRVLRYVSSPTSTAPTGAAV